MRIVGTSPALAASFFPEGFVTTILEFVLRAWTTLQPAPHPAEKEEALTGRLYEHLIDLAPSNLPPLFIMPETPLYDAATGKVKGRTDFRFLHREIPGQRLYLVMEAKRLRIPKSKERLFRNTAAYCGPEGMGRFVGGKYSAGLPEAAMLGYVMDGDVNAAATEVSVFCEKIRKRLLAQLKPAVAGHPALTAPMAHSRHKRSAAHGGDLTLHHLFVAV